MENFEFISAHETYKNLFYQLPRIFFTSDYYKEMSNDSKIAYAILQDRFEYSLKNNWIDENNNIYFIYTRAELMEILGCKENKIAKIKKELREKNLLYEKRIPPKRQKDGSFKNFPNRLYLGRLKVTATDVYLVSESGKNQLSEKTDNISVSVESGKNQLPEKTFNTNTFSESGKNHPNQYKELKEDTIKEDTKRKDTNKPVDLFQQEKSSRQEQYLLSHYAETHAEQSFLDQRNLELIGLFSENIVDAENMQGIILRAKKSIERKYDTTLLIDHTYVQNEFLDIQGEIAKTLRRIYQKRKTDHKIKNIDNYAYGSFKNVFAKLIADWNHSIVESKDNSDEVESRQTVTVYDWVNN